MLNTKFQASEPSGSEAEDCFHVFLCFTIIEPRTCYLPNFKRLRQMVLKKRIFFIIFHVFT